MASVFRRKGQGAYTIQYTGADGLRKTAFGGPDKDVAKRLATKLEHEALLRRKGIIDRTADKLAAAEAKPIAEHAAEYEAHLRNKGVSPKQVRAVRARVNAVLAACGFTRLSELDASKLEAFLAEKRADRVDDKGRAVRGLSVATANYYAVSLKAFAAWLVRNGRLQANPFVGMGRGNVQTDRRHDRRALSDDELRRLLDAARTGSDWWSVPGRDRWFVYRMGCEAGLRVSEIRSLTVGSFALTGDTPTVTVGAAFSKHRREDVQPIPVTLAADLQGHFRGKLAGVKAFRMPPADAMAKMIRKDLSVARTCWLSEAPDEAERAKREASDFLAYRDSDGRYADFHALRHTYISNLARAGVHPKVAMDLARHSDINLTLARYSHTVIGERAEALAGLPDLSGNPPQRQRATGTYDVRASAPDDACSALQNAQHSPAPNGHQPPSSAANVGNGNASESARNPLQASRVSNACHYSPSSTPAAQKTMTCEPPDRRPRLFPGTRIAKRRPMNRMMPGRGTAREWIGPAASGSTLMPARPARRPASVPREAAAGPPRTTSRGNPGRPPAPSLPLPESIRASRRTAARVRALEHRLIPLRRNLACPDPDWRPSLTSLPDSLRAAIRADVSVSPLGQTGSGNGAATFYGCNPAADSPVFRCILDTRPAFVFACLRVRRRRRDRPGTLAPHSHQLIIPRR